MNRSALSRIAAFAVDWLLLSLYAGLWFGAMVLILGLDGLERQAESYDALRGQAIGFVTLTLPFILYFAIAESSSWQASVGKRLLSIRTVTRDGSRPQFPRTLARATVKFLPWEIAHVFTNHLFEHSMRTPETPEPSWFWVVFVLSMGTAMFYASSLFFGDGRTPYDRISGTRIEPR